MGAWGTGPLDNDNVADWFAEVFDRTGFREALTEGLSSGHPDAVRGAAWAIARLAKVYVWPIDHLDEDRIAAAAGLLRLQQDADWLASWDEPREVKAELAKELRALALEPSELAQAQELAGATPAKSGRVAKSTTRKKVAKKKKATKKKKAAKNVAKKATKKTATKKATKKATAKNVAKPASARSAPAPSGKGWTRLTFQQGTSHKFWAIRVQGDAFTVHYGRVGSDGRQKTKTFASPAQAQAAAETLIGEKRRKGYA
ncbi:MAG: WGR domain-containing protein [Planctomycetota bacterium]